ncbi:MAG: discoidin domain-containing protein [Myxococcales bacterium]|nr:discoidin domain-containing protein [Myxococcales bacterium]MDH3485016.1 discoidin domain-containing protein [Myxococcales bacterium]
MSDTFRRRFLGWFSQQGITQESRKQVAAKSHRRTKLEQYAMTSAEAGDRALRPVTPLRSGSGEVVSALLHKESIRATLLALGSSIGGLAEDEALRARVTQSLPRSVSFERLCELIAEPSDIEGVEGNLRVGSAEAEALAGAARALLDVARAPERQLQRALARRFLRTSVPVLLLALAVVFGAETGARLALGHDLAEGKPWRASSAYRGFSADEGICDGNRTSIFFHTNREEEPWVELDLGDPTFISRVDVQNRRDCCRDRSFPLAIEGSLDGQEWQVLGRQTEPFSKWVLEFEPTEARYVRAKALKRTFLHLESLEVR